tara:strand:+ start:2588 stop:2767 length:180 start_codon:yes stop_codon:yes gene_type:complete
MTANLIYQLRRKVHIAKYEIRYRKPLLVEEWINFIGRVTKEKAGLQSLMGKPKELLITF